MPRRAHPLLLALVLAVAAAAPAGASTSVSASASPAASPLGVFVRVQDGLDAAAVVRAHAPGVEVVREYPLISAAFVAGPAVSIGRLSGVDTVVSVQEDRPLQWLGDTSSWATRVRVVQEAVAGGPYVDGSGNPLLGSGVGVAVVDSGVNALHPDLRNSVARNYVYVCTTPGLVSTVSDMCYGNSLVDQANGDPSPTFGMVDVGDTNSDPSGHGTLVAGVIAGDGTMSTGSYPAGTGPNVKGTFTGVAPGATLYSYTAGAVISTSNAVELLYHILQNGNSFTPRVSVLNVSWGGPDGNPFNPSDIVNVLVDRLVVDNGVTVVVPAGNGGGNGLSDRTTSQCKNPTPGVICVANYDDAGTGRRDGTLHPTSSRGHAADAATWPDISAPGTNITSTCVQVVQPLCTGGETRWPPWYSSFTGTSAAAAHVSGVVALLRQADPSLTPAEIEDLLKNTAYKFTFGASYLASAGTGTSSYDKGAGLVDAKAALDAMGAAHATASPPNNLQLAGGDGGDFHFGAGDLVSLAVTQTATGFRYDIALNNAADFGPGNVATAAYRLYQTVRGVEYAIGVTATAGAVVPGPAIPAASTAEAVTRVGNTVSFSVPFTKLGNPAVGDPIRNVRVGAFFGAGARPIVDMAPSADAGAVALTVRPMYGRPYARA